MVYETLNKRVLMFGGGAGGAEESNDIWASDPGINTWSENSVP